MEPLLMGDHLRQLKPGRERPARNVRPAAVAIALAITLAVLALAAGLHAAGYGHPPLSSIASKEIAE